MCCFRSSTRHAAVRCLRDPPDVPLLDRGDPLLLLQAFLDALDAVTRLDVDFNLLARQGLHLDHLRRDENEKGDTEKDEAEDVSTWAPGGG